MVNKLLALVLCCVLLLCALPLTGQAATFEEKQALKTAVKSSYYTSLATAGKESFNGFCGMMTSHQLWHMGINPGLLSADGNKQYDMYSAMKKTNAGYYICSYSAEEYTLERALNVISHNGTKDVYNLLVGFEWTNTPSGEKYGHAVVINGILDGKVYFAESFYTSLGGPEGSVVVCTIEEFAAMFADWTLFEGVIHFAGKDYIDSCKEYPTDLFVRARFAMDLRSQPCLIGADGCKAQRSVTAGERLRVTAVLKNPDGEWYYRVEDGEQIGYLVADTAMLYRTNAEDISMEPFTMDLPAEDGDDLQISGSIEAKNTLIGAVEIAVTDQQGQVVSQSRRITDSFAVDLRTLNDDLDLSELEDGAYTVTVRAETAAAYISMGQLHYSNKTILLGQQSMLIGNAEAPARARTAPLKEEKDGWYWENGTWYLYKNNAPQTGWIRDGGVRYYLQADGSVTTGTAKIDGKEYCFSSTGALCTGWITSGFNTGYVLPDGTTAYGWQIINGSRYFFDVQGNMVRRGTLMDGGVKYQFQSDGKATPVMDK